jgi:hypothetical protein
MGFELATFQSLTQHANPSTSRTRSRKRRRRRRRRRRKRRRKRRRGRRRRRRRRRRKRKRRRRRTIERGSLIKSSTEQNLIFRARFYANKRDKYIR